MATDPKSPDTASSPESRDIRDERPVYSWRFRLLVYVATGIGAFLLWCWFKTLRVTRVGPEPPAGSGFPHATWHRGVLYAPFLWRWRGGVMMASASRDGEWAAGIIKRFGNNVVRGSSHRGGRTALAKLTEIIAAGSDGGLLPDAPRGPPRKAKPGILALAQRAEQPIIPVAFAARRAKYLNSWDRTMLPYPFTRMVVIFGEPFFVAPDLEREAFDRRLAEFDDAMNLVTDQADAYFSCPPET